MYTTNLYWAIFVSQGLVSEADYSMEASNAKNFLRAMESRGLTALTAPIVVDELSGPRVLVTTWINGTRLDASNSPDVPRCGIHYLLIIYTILI